MTLKFKLSDDRIKSIPEKLKIIEIKKGCQLAAFLQNMF
jgi:hypothetical protein